VAAASTLQPQEQLTRQEQAGGVAGAQVLPQREVESQHRVMEECCPVPGLQPGAGFAPMTVLSHTQPLTAYPYYLHVRLMGAQGFGSLLGNQQQQVLQPQSSTTSAAAGGGSRGGMLKGALGGLGRRFGRSSGGTTSPTEPTAQPLGGGMAAQSALPTSLALRLRTADGAVEAREGPFPLSGGWPLLEAALPVSKPSLGESDLLHIELLDASRGLDWGGAGFGTSMPTGMATGAGMPVVGRILVMLDPLLDGHVSRNTFSFDGIGGTIQTILHLEPKTAHGGSSSGVGTTTGTGAFGSHPTGYGWKPEAGSWRQQPLRDTSAAGFGKSSGFTNTGPGAGSGAGGVGTAV
jgi:hypothetical protein